MIGDATLFSRTDLVEAAWRVAQPLLDAWTATTPYEFPNYPAGSWGPKAAFGLIERDGRQWVEVINREVLEQVPLFHGSGPVFLQNLAMMLKPVVYSAGDFIFKKGDMGNEMYFICRGKVEVLDGEGKTLSTLYDGDYFGEISLLLSQPRTASIRAAKACDLFVLEKADFKRALDQHPQFAASLRETVKKRYPSAAF
jgi:glucose-6-phosphate 1-dehydrogenase